MCGLISSWVYKAREISHRKWLLSQLCLLSGELVLVTVGRRTFYDSFGAAKGKLL